MSLRLRILPPLLTLALLGTAATSFAQRDVPELRVQEWGVWLIERDEITVEALAAESPPFVVRAREASQSPDGPPPDHVPHMPDGEASPSPGPARKPVIFFHSAAPLDVQVRVRFPGGQPWLLYPGASRASRGSRPPRVARNQLFWRGVVGGEGTAPAVDSDHWWQSLRDVGADGFLTDRGEFEHFLFYDGVVPFRRRVTFARLDGSQPPVVKATRGADGPVFLVSPAGFSVHQANESGRGSMTERERGPLSGLTGRLRPELLARGLHEAEADALLEVWSDELVGQAGAGDDTRVSHAIYFVSREDYDRMLPITINPQPTALVRVGVVIELFER